MKYIFIILLSVVSLGIISAQNLIPGTTRINPGNQCKLITTDPLFVLIVDSTEFKIKEVSDLDPEWIERVTVLKDEKLTGKYHNDVGVILIYIKKKYRKRMLKKLKSQGIISTDKDKSKKIKTKTKPSPQ